LTLIVQQVFYSVKSSLGYKNVLHTLPHNVSFKNYMLKGSLGNQNRFLYGVTEKKNKKKTKNKHGTFIL